MTEQQLAAMRQALRKAFNLGSTYWQQADSEYTSQWKKADVTLASFNELVETTITALRTAIEAETAQGQEPVAWNSGVPPLYPEMKDGETISVEYAAKPAQEFVCSTGLCHYRKPLTDERLMKMQQQEPVANASAWFALVMNAAAELEDASHCLLDEDAKRVAISGAKHYRDAAKALYTTPPNVATPLAAALKPLTDEQIGKMYNTHLRDGGQIQRFARAIEAAHGIGAKK